MSGIFGDLDETLARLKIKGALFGASGPADFVGSLTDDETDQLLAACLNVDRAGLATVADFVVENVNEETRRDQVRERVWAIEADIAARIATELTEEHERAMGAARQGTRKTYAKDRAHFIAFCEGLGVPALPASAGAMAAYILSKPSSLRRRLSAIAEWHRLNGYVGPANDPLVRVALRVALAPNRQPGTPARAAQKESTNGKA